MRTYDPAVHPPLLCIGCRKTPAEIGYSYFRLDEDGKDLYGSDDNYVWNEEGTLNTANGHFLCDTCYVKAGSPSSRFGWKAP